MLAKTPSTSLNRVVHKTSLQSRASKKKLYRIVDRQSSNLTLQQFTASARKHSEYLYLVVHETSLQSVQAKTTTTTTTTTTEANRRSSTR